MWRRWWLLLLFVLCCFARVVCSRAVHTNVRTDDKCSDFGREKKERKKRLWFCELTSDLRCAAFGADVVGFLLRLIQENTPVLHVRVLFACAQVSHYCFSHTHTSKHPHVQDAAHADTPPRPPTHTHGVTEMHTHTHTLCSPLLWLSAGLGILMSPALFVNAAN